METYTFGAEDLFLLNKLFMKFDIIYVTHFP